MNENDASRLKELRVLTIATTFPRWEGDKEPPFVFDLNKELARKVSLMTLVPHAPGAKKEETLEGVRVIRFPYFFPSHRQNLFYEGGALPKLRSSWLARIQLPFFLLLLFYHMVRCVKRYRINLIHCHWIIPQGWFTVWLRKILGVPCLLTAHGGDVFSFKKDSLVARFSRFAIKHANLCSSNTETTRQAILDLYPKAKVKVIPMGVDTSGFHPNQRRQELKNEWGVKGPLFLAVGRLAEKKGFKYLIQAMPEVLRELPQAKLLLIGEGPEKGELETLIEQLKLGENVILAGGKNREELPSYFASADIFIGPSIVAESGDTEGQGVVFLEAMASGTPVIASNVGGISDVILNGETGILVPQKNPQAIASAVISLYSDVALRERLSLQGREMVESCYSWKASAASFLQLYIDIV